MIESSDEKTIEEPNQEAEPVQTTERRPLTKEELENRRSISETRQEIIDLIRDELDCEELDLTILKELRGEIPEGVVVNERSPEGWIQARGVLIALKDSLSTVFKRLDELKSSPEGHNYQRANERKKEIIETLTSIAFQEHLTASDISGLVSGIKITDSKTLVGLSPEQQSSVLKSRERFGYEGVMFYDESAREIVIFQEALADKHEKGDLDLQHMLSHEISHGVVDKSVLQKENIERVNKIEAGNPGVLVAVREILDNANTFLPFQTRHIRTVLNKQLKGIFYNPESLTENQSAEITEKFGSIENYLAVRIDAAKEILSDYTAIFLQSDGKFRGFVLGVMSKCNQGELRKFTGEGIESRVANLTGDEEDEESLIDNLSDDDTTKTILKSYFKFFKNIKTTLAECKGKFGSTEFIEDMDYLEDLDETDTSGMGRGTGSKASLDPLGFGQEIMRFFGFNKQD